MVDVLDLLRCPICGTFYKPKTTPTGRTIPHCWTGVTTGRWSGRHVKGLSLGQRVEQAAIEMDFAAIEARVVGSRLTEDVVDPPLTGSLLDIEV